MVWARKEAKKPELTIKEQLFPYNSPWDESRIKKSPRKINPKDLVAVKSPRKRSIRGASDAISDVDAAHDAAVLTTAKVVLWGILFCTTFFFILTCVLAFRFYKKHFCGDDLPEEASSMEQLRQ